MNDRHIAWLRTTLRELADDTPRAFYFAEDGDRRILHIARRITEPARFSGIAAINRHLTSRGLSEPVSARARCCAGTVVRQEGVLWFDIAIKRRVGKSDLRRALKVLRRPLKLGDPQVGRPKTEQTGPADRLEKLLGQIRAAAPPGDLSDNDLEALVRRSRKYLDRGGTDPDVGDRFAAAEAEWLARVEAAETARHEEVRLAAEDIVRRVMSGGAPVDPERLRDLHEVWDDHDEEDEFAAYPAALRLALAALAEEYEPIKQEYEQLSLFLSGELSATLRAEVLDRVAELRDRLQGHLDTIRAVVQ